MKRKIVWILALSFVAGLSGCGKGVTEDTTTEMVVSVETITEEIVTETEVSTEEDEEVKVTVTYESIVNNKTFEDEEIIFSSYLRPLITVEGRDDVNETIRQDFDSDLEAFYARGVKLEEDVEACYREGLDEEYPIYGYNTVSYWGRRLDDRVISFIRTDDYGYTDNIQNNDVISFVNYDAKTGKKLLLGDIAEDQEEFLAVAKKYIQMLCETDYYKSILMSDYMERLDSMLSDGLWYFDRGGITFILDNSLAEVLPEYRELQFTIPYDKLVGLKPEYEYREALHQVAHLGQKLWIDLDGDGKEDEIFFDADAQNDKRLLMINGEDYSQIFELGYEQGFDWIGFENPNEYYAVLDIDSSDQTKELAIQDNGPSDDPVTAFLRYENGNISFVGTIPNYASVYGIISDGEGRLETSQRMGILASYDIDVCYELEGDKLVMVKEELYPLSNSDVITGSSTSFQLLCDITVYERMDTNDSKVALKQGTMINIVATDNIEWIKIQDEQGAAYYVHIVNWGTVDSDGKEINAMDVFSNLWQAG